MPFFYDLVRAFTANGTPATESTHLWGKTIANQQMVAISGIYCAARFGTSGGGLLRAKYNTGTTASGGSAQTPNPRHPLMRAADSVWANDGSGITPGGTLVNKVSIGFSQTGGMGGWVATEPDAQMKMMPNATNPVDVEFASICLTASVLAELSVEFKEGG